MALRIPVQKDIGEYEEKIVGKMSLRTLACVTLGFGSAVGAAAFVHLGLHADVADAAFPIMLCSMPFWLAGFWRPFGMRAEELLPLLAAHELSPQLLAYEPCLAASLPEGSPRPGRPGRRARRRARKKGAELYVSVNLFFTSFANQTRRSRKGGFTACANVFSPIPVTL